MSQAGGEAVAPHAVRGLDAIDRFFPLVWLGLYVLLPASGRATLAFASWFDQSRDLEALRSVLADGSAEAIDNDLIGPAYIASAALIHVVTGLSPEDSLVTLTRISYAFSVVAGLVLVRVLVGRLTGAPPMASLGAQLVFLALVFAARTWQWSDLPWSHFFAAFLVLAFFVARLAPPRLEGLSAVAVGVVLALLALTRSFELLAVVAAWGLGAALLGALRLRPLPVPRTATVALGAGAFVATAVAVHVATGKRDLFFLYRGLEAFALFGDFAPENVAETPTLSIAYVPVKAVQLVVDPCFYSLCSQADYSSGGSPWQLPLAIQLPALVLLPLCVLAMGAVLVRFARHRERAPAHARELGLLTEMTIVASGVALGYLASTLTGSSHLKYGYAREFFVPALLSGIVAVTLAAAGLWHLLGRDARSSSGRAVFIAALGAVVAVVGVVTVARERGLPRLESRHVGSVTYSAACRGRACDVELEATTVGGEPLSIPRTSMLTFRCASGVRLTLYERDPAGGVTLDPACSSPRLVAAWPTVMGLPPTARELRAVGVENATAG